MAIMDRFRPPPAGAPTYAEARAEVIAAIRNLGLLFGSHPDDADRSISDLVTAVYSGGWNACESRLDSPDVADAICTALETPAAVLEQNAGESMHHWQVRAVQQVIAYGIPKR